MRFRLAMRARWTFMAALFAAVVAGLSPLRAQQLPVPDLSAADHGQSAADGTLAGSVARDPSCSERTNGCAVCVRRHAGEMSCSLPGIACQPESWRCAQVGVQKETGKTGGSR